MDTKIILISTIAFLVVLAGCSSGVPGFDTGEFAKCLTANGVKMYGAYWCPHCANQKKMFGSDFKHVEYVECSLSNKGGKTQVCLDEEIAVYPTWEFPDGSREQGVLSFDILAERGGC